jgi:hypothetical protein
MSCQSLKKLFSAFLKMPYYKNHAASSGHVHNYAKHEIALAHMMEAHGYKRFAPLCTLKQNDFGNDDFLHNMPAGSFIEQPFGSHRSPDFIIKTIDKKLICLEAKSSCTAAHPTYNSGGVKHGYYYVFCSQKSNSTTVFRGEDIITQQQQLLITEHIAEEKRRATELNDKLKALDINDRGISYYPRAMIMQKGGRQQVNYFSHKNRKRDEMRVMESLL